MFSTDRYDQLQECAIECLQKLGQSVPGAYFHPLILLFKGYFFPFEDVSVFCFFFICEKSLLKVNLVFSFFFFAQIINEEDGGIHRRHASPSVRDRGALTSFTSQSSAPSNLSGYGTSAIVAMDRSSSLQSGTSLSSGLLLSQAKSRSKVTERSLESVLHSSKQKVTAIESMLRGLDLSDKHNSSMLRSSSLDLGTK